MQNILFTLGIVLGSIAILVVDAYQILKFNSSKKDDLAEVRLFEGLSFGSAIGMCIILIFKVIYLLF